MNLLVERLFQHLQNPSERARMSAEPRHQPTNPIINSRPDATPPPKARHRPAHRPAPGGLAVGGIASTVVRNPQLGLISTTTLREPTSACMVYCEQALSAPFDSASSESPPPESTSGSSESSDSADSSSDIDRCHRRRWRTKRAPETPLPAYGHSYLRSWLPVHIMRPDLGQAGNPNMKKGKYFLFDKLLPPLDDGQAAKKGSTRRQVSTSAPWMEAWNIFAATRIQTARQTALELVKYQSIICQLFTAYSTAAASSLLVGGG